MAKKVFNFFLLCFFIIKLLQYSVYVKANYPIFQGVEYTSNEFNEIGFVDYMEGKTLKGGLTVVNIKATLNRPVHPEFVSL